MRFSLFLVTTMKKMANNDYDPLWDRAVILQSENNREFLLFFVRKRLVVI